MQDTNSDHPYNHRTSFMESETFSIYPIAIWVWFSGCIIPAPTTATSSTTFFFTIVVEVKVSGPPHHLKLWSRGRKCMLPVKYFCSTTPVFVSIKFNGDQTTAYRDEPNLATLSVGKITGFKTMVSVCLSTRAQAQKLM